MEWYTRKDNNQPRWKVRGPTPSGDIVDWKVFYSIRKAKKYVAMMGDRFFIVPIKRSTHIMR